MSQQFAFAAVLRKHRPFVTDPCGLGIKIYHLSTADPTYQKWVSAQQAKNPMMAQMIAIVGTVQGKAMIRAIAQGHDGDALAAKVEQASEEGQREALEKMADSFELKAEDVEALAIDLTLEKTMRLADGWDNVTGEDGEPVKFSEGAARAFFAQNAVIPPPFEHEDGVTYGSDEYAGQSFGAVMATRLVEAAETRAATEAAQSMLAKKDSGLTIDGDSSRVTDSAPKRLTQAPPSG